MKKRFFLIVGQAAILIFLSQMISAQSTEFTYQGRLLSGGVPANGSHDFEFRLFSDPDSNSQVGSAITLTAVNVNNGVFSVRLDFGNLFPGSNRYLEIRVRQAGQEFFSVLTPRQAITSAPYAIKSLNAENATNSANATQLGGVSSSQYVLTNDSRMSDARNPLPNSPSYIQNTSSVQASSNFNISGNGTANILNAATQFNLRGSRILGTSMQQNLFVGFFAGQSNPTGDFNSFFGTGAGYSNTSGQDNSFFGNLAGNANTTGNVNSFFGSGAGLKNTTGSGNTFFGGYAGKENTTGSSNSFFGFSAGNLNTTGGSNSFFGVFSGNNNTAGINNSFYGASSGISTTTGSSNAFFGAGGGIFNTTGANNSFFGLNAGASNTTEFNNSFFGALSDGAAGISNATAIGFRAKVTQSNSLILGSINGINGATADTRVGIGTTAPNAKLTVAGLSNSITTPLAVLQTTGNQIPLGFFSGNIEVARIRADSSGNLVLAALGGASRDIYLRAGDDSGADLFIESSTGNVGIGTTAPVASLNVRANNGNALIGNAGCSSGFVGIGFGASLAGCNNYSLLGNGTDTFINRAPGGTLYFREGNTTQMFIAPGGAVTIPGNLTVNALTTNSELTVTGKTIIGLLGSGTNTTPLCLNSANQISTCSSSSIRYKENINPFNSGLNLIKRLRPVFFNWKNDNTLDFGLVAEEVFKIEPLLTFRNNKGETEGVKYDRLGVVLINALQEQQLEIEAQQKQIDEQKEIIRRHQVELDALKKFICSQSPQADFCQPKK